MNIVIVAHFSDDLDIVGNNRFNYLAEILSERGHHVELITSNFSHVKKFHRDFYRRNNAPYLTTMISEPGYAKNVSLRRIFSHRAMAKNLHRYLMAKPKPDVMYCAVPSIAVALCAARYAIQRDIRLIVDVQDLWPEAFQLVFKHPRISSLIFRRTSLNANEIYASADALIAVSNEYLKRALQANKKRQCAFCVYLGTELDRFDREVAVNQGPHQKNDEIWVAYAGTMGHSYDLICVIDALRLIQGRTNRHVRLIAMGDGPYFEKFRRYAIKQGIAACFPGRIGYGEMAAMLSMCDIAVNPITAGARQSIINKHADYAAAGLPVVNTQESPEYRSLLDTYSAGLNCAVGCAEDVADKMVRLIDNESLREEMGKNSRRMAEALFDRKKTYATICLAIERAY